MAEKRRRAAAAANTARTLFLLVVLGAGAYILTHRGGAAPAAPAPGGRTLADYDVESPVRTHGRLKKRGPLGALSMVGSGRSRAELCFPADWREARLAGDKQPPPAKWCAIMFNDRYKLIYVKCPKTAGTTLVTYFTDCSAPDATDRCFRLLDYTNATMVRHLLDSWDDYFAFSFSRNVLRRAISQYQYLSTFVREEPGCPRLSWDEYCVDPFLLGDVCQAEATRVCCTQSAEHQYVHASPQVNCFTTQQGHTALDWLGRVEHFEDDFKALIKLLNRRKNGAPKLPTDVLPTKANYNASPCKEGGAEGGTAAGADISSSGGGSSGGGLEGEDAGGDAARRRLRWGWDVRNDTENPCDKNDFFRGSHAHCYAAIMSFYAEDMQLLARRRRR
ncbi:hypothetical protein ABPG75_001116 [Micractinium tetrahymenae]